MNARFQIALHILILLDHSEVQLLSSEYIAGSLNTDPALVRTEISNLRNYSLTHNKEGKGGGYTLGLPAGKITFDMVYRTVRPGSLLGSSKNQPNPACPIGRRIGAQIGNLYDEVDHEVLTKLSTIMLARSSKNFE